MGPSLDVPGTVGKQEGREGDVEHGLRGGACPISEQVFIRVRLCV